jgi:hypothetical protein
VDKTSGYDNREKVKSALKTIEVVLRSWLDVDYFFTVVEKILYEIFV